MHVTTDVRASVQRFGAMLLADLRERTRSPRFWVVLGLMVVASWLCFPPPGAGYMILSIHGSERGFYSSAWVGMVLASVFSTLLSLCGFYLVRGTLVRDIDSRVWQLLVATPMTRGGYLLAKWASHMVMFSLIASVALCVGLVAQWVRAEDRSIHLLELVKPVLLLNLPGLAVTAMLAIWFDLLPWLRRTAGNVIFFFLWVVMLTVPLARVESPSNMLLREGWVSDTHGMILMARDFHRSQEQRTGKPDEFGFNIGSPATPKGPSKFEWKSWSVRPMDVLGRGLWLLLAMAGVLLAAPLLDWAASRTSAAARSVASPGRRLRWLDRLLAPLARGPTAIVAIAELRLSLRQRRAWWWLVALAAMVAQAFGKGDALHLGLLLAWVLPLDMLSRNILREVDNGTGGLVFTAPQILRRLLVARFATGFGLLVALSLPGLIRLFATAPLSAVAVLVVCASIASWALSLSAACRNPRPFELLLLVAAYLSTQSVPIFDIALAPQATAAWHAVLMLPAWVVLAWAWPRLASATHRRSS